MEPGFLTSGLRILRRAARSRNPAAEEDAKAHRPGLHKFLDELTRRSTKAALAAAKSCIKSPGDVPMRDIIVLTCWIHSLQRTLSHMEHLDSSTPALHLPAVYFLICECVP